MDWNAYNDFGGRSNYVAAGELPLEPAVNVRQISPYLRDTGGRWWSRPDDDYAPLSFDRPEPVNRIDLEETITDADVADRLRARGAGHVAARRLARARGLRVPTCTPRTSSTRACSTSIGTRS